MTANKNIDEILDDVYRMGKTDQLIKTDDYKNLKLGIKQALYTRLLEVIGADDVIYGVGTGSDEKRGANLLRAAQRKALAEMFGIKESK